MDCFSLYLNGGIVHPRIPFFICTTHLSLMVHYLIALLLGNGVSNILITKMEPMSGKELQTSILTHEIY